ncbi:hypothetical protein O181_035113 [Austropuccinia psidii MF-1]|uniref:Uncharacterized protein n=1 Tax=Austropuccinia psidii MF-1 TaxID=1389203 RepID=A0A9Q3H7Z4_9BASI|nr:hypothetical protein [Austropuccinia psidii MF-1]
MKLILLLIFTDHTLQYLADQLTRKPWSIEALGNLIPELIQLGVMRNVGHNEEVEVTNPVIIDWHNDKYRMDGNFREFDAYRALDRYPITKIPETSTQLSKAKYKTSMDEFKGFHQNF